MEVIVFAIVVAAVAIVGVRIGLALAPRLGRWDERHSRTAGDDPVDGGGDDRD